MKLDGEPLHHHSCPSRDLPPEVVEHSDNHLVDGALEVDNNVVREEGFDTMSLIERNSCEKVTDLSQNKDGHGQHGYAGMENPTNSNQNKGKIMEAPCSFPTAKIEVDEKETDFYTDKTVTEIELPEMIVYLKDGVYHVIKDICIDDGLHSPEKIFIEKDNVGHKNFYNYNHSATNGSRYLSQETTDSAVLIADDLKSLVSNEHPISDLDKDSAKQGSSECLLGAGEKLGINKIVNTISDEKIIVNQFLSLQELDAGRWHLDSSSYDCSNDQQQSTHASNCREKIDQGALEEVMNSTDAPVPPDAKGPNQSNGTKETPFNGSVESGRITFDFDSGLPALSGREETKENTDYEQPGDFLNSSEHEEVAHDGPTASARSSFVHNHGESSFSGPASLSGRIAYSGEIPFSGSISLRSDSSTISARSFAFPILQSEWNSSPIRMKKANHRHMRKHRGWGMGLLCCRF